MDYISSLSHTPIKEARQQHVPLTAKFKRNVGLANVQPCEHMFGKYGSPVGFLRNPKDAREKLHLPFSFVSVPPGCERLHFHKPTPALRKPSLRAAKTPLQERGRAAPAPPRCRTPSGATGTASSPERRSPVPPPPPRAAPQGREPSRSAALPPTPQPPARSAAREGRPPPSCPHKGTKAAAPLPRAPSRAAPAPQPRRPFPRRPTHLQAQRGTAAPQELADVAQALALRARLRVHLEEKRRRLSADPAPRGAARPPLPHLPLPPLLTRKGLNREVNTERRKWRARAEGTAHSSAAAAPAVQRGTGAGAGTRGAERGRRLAPGLSESGILGGF